MIRLDDSFYMWLPRIREKPGLFLGEPSLIALSHFWKGYAFRAMSDELESQKHMGVSEQHSGAVVHGELSRSQEEHFMDGFEKFAYSYFNCEWSTQGWAKLIVKNCKSDEEAFYKFFELLDEFMSRSGKNENMESV